MLPSPSDHPQKNQKIPTVAGQTNPFKHAREPIKPSKQEAELFIIQQKTLALAQKERQQRKQLKELKAHYDAKVMELQQRKEEYLSQTQKNKVALDQLKQNNRSLTEQQTLLEEKLKSAQQMAESNRRELRIVIRERNELIIRLEIMEEKEKAEQRVENASGLDETARIQERLTQIEIDLKNTTLDHKLTLPDKLHKIIQLHQQSATYHAFLRSIEKDKFNKIEQELLATSHKKTSLRAICHCCQAQSETFQANFAEDVIFQTFGRLDVKEEQKQLAATAKSPFYNSFSIQNEEHRFSFKEAVSIQSINVSNSESIVIGPEGRYSATTNCTVIEKILAKIEDYKLQDYADLYENLKSIVRLLGESQSQGAILQEAELILQQISDFIIMRAKQKCQRIENILSNRPIDSVNLNIKLNQKSKSKVDRPDAKYNIYSTPQKKKTDTPACRKSQFSTDRAKKIRESLQENYPFQFSDEVAHISGGLNRYSNLAF